MSFGQHSNGIESNSSTLRILYPGTKNTYGTNLTNDAFTQANPPLITTPGTISTQLPIGVGYGVRSGSIAFTRPDVGNGFIGGPTLVTPAKGKIRPVGFYINHVADINYENRPAEASNQGTYVTGTLGIGLYETQVLGGGNVGDPIEWGVGDEAFASINGYITNLNDADNALEAYHGYATVFTVGVVRIIADNVHPDIVLSEPI